MRKLLLLKTALLLIVINSFAQGSIKGKLTDSSGKNPFSFATVTIFKAADTSLITYRLSKPDGEFKVSGIPLNLACRMVVSFSGNDTYRKEFMLTSADVVDFGNIILKASSGTMEEVVIVAERPPVTVRRDTIEFNAASFKTLPTALVEDLLRKLPGVEVDRDGNITANGKRVNRIMVDGKAFFGDDPKMATRNLPSNVIDKIQVTNDKEEAARNTDGDLTNVGQVINLTLKKGIKKGWFGKVYGGVGTNSRYEAGGIANIYRDTMQLSLLGFSNNVNRSGFSFKEVQDIGGFSRSGFNSVSIRSRGGQTGFNLNGISFGGMDAGIAQTTGGGFNLNHAPTKNNSFFLQYFLGNTRNNIEQLYNAQQFINDTILNSRTNSTNRRNTFTHNAGMGANLKPDTLTDITFRGNFAYTSSIDNVLSELDNSNNKTGTLSAANGTQNNTAFNGNYNHYLYVTRRFKAKRGRTLNLNQSVNYNSNLQRYITEQENNYFYPSTYNRLFNQLRRQDVPALSVNNSVSFSEPLSKKFTLRVNGQYQFLKDVQDVSIYNKDGNTAKYDDLNTALAQGFQRHQNKISSQLSLSYKVKKVTITAGANALWQSIHNNFKTAGAATEIHLFNVLPSLSFNWKQLSAQVSRSVNAPGIANLIPVPDSTNPFYIRYGNPLLKPARRTNFYMNNYSFFQASGTSLNFFINGGYVDDDVVQSRTVLANGVQIIKPVNANGSINFYAGVGYGKEFKKNPKFIYSFRFSPFFNYNKNKLIVNNNVSTASTIDAGPNFSLSFNWNDVVEFRPSYSPGLNFTSYTDPSFTNIKAITHSIDNELIVRLPKKLVWETNISYRYNSVVAPGLPKENVLWNAAVTLLMMKGDLGQLKLGVYDILNTNNGYYRYTTQNQIVDTRTNVLNRYTSLTFTYNIRNIGASKKVGGRDRMFLF